MIYVYIYIYICTIYIYIYMYVTAYESLHLAPPLWRISTDGRVSPYIYMYIYMYRERERERDSDKQQLLLPKFFQGHGVRGHSPTE